ncbi:hypothetical protein ACA910_019925 [Epithemia clementina (nom. ined.)]
MKLNPSIIKELREIRGRSSVRGRRNSAMSSDQPILSDLVERLKSLDANLLERSPQDIADVYAAAIAFMVRLKQDQTTLQKRRRQNAEHGRQCPPPEEIPAITCILTDAELFSAFLSCLKVGNGQQLPMATENISNGRKRSLSVTGSEPSSIQAKVFKASHASPVPSRKSSLVVDLKTQQKPSFQLHALAATILAIALAHVDHWPMQLVEAYVVDCFGSRAWVDEEQCALLVQNLSLVHSATSEANDSLRDSAFLENASKVASAYQSFKVQRATSSTTNVKRPQGIDLMGSMQEMERTVSTDTVDSAVRAQAPYEIDWNGNGADEDEQERVPSIPSALSTILPKKRKIRGDDSSSSGGGDEEVVSMAAGPKNSEIESKPAKMRRKSSSSVAGTGVQVQLEGAHYPLQQSALDLQLVRQRYFGENLKAAHEAIHRALLDRLEQKSRQNSGLLQTLPYFTSVPSVRSVVAENLSRWLQSPALAGLARKLFSGLVDHMQNVDPPLPEDMRAIDSILAMKLKANQFAAHIENVTAVATRIPTLTIAQHIYTTLMHDALSTVSDPVQGGFGDSITMVCGVHKALPPAVSYSAAAAALLTLLVQAESLPKQVDKTTRDRTVFKLRQIIRTLSKSLGASFDTFQLMEALLSLEFDEQSREVRNEEDKARLMFQCVTIHVSAASSGHLKATKDLEESEKREATRKSLHKARKSLLTWCCTDYGPRWSSARKPRRENDDETKAGAGIPNYTSAIGPNSGEESIPTWLNTMRCLLFIEEANSDLMSRFLAPSQVTSEEEATNTGEQERIKACCAYGADIDDDMIRIVLRAHSPRKGSLPAEMAIQLLEHLFESCGRTRGTSLRVSDPELVWELYKLAQYTPPVHLLSGKNTRDLKLGDRDSTDDIGGLPRLAYPGFWWRATMLGLVMCGAAPQEIGDVVWREHPTLRSLMKMITAGRYRFPTVDCDELAKEEMKRLEHDCRESDNVIAEFLFLPAQQPKENKNEKSTGNRVSRRLMKRQEEREAAAELAESIKRKKMLKSAQKSIMLWDPDGPARKPPREAADLLLSIEKMFDLSAAFQGCTTPDFLLLTIGETSRGAIERAYDWLIPIISRLPGLISRLPSSASCFLLLRAYGTETGDNSQLKELSAPLLRHVKESLRGKYGEDDCIRAFELLMSDAASHNADRRMSARRVLQDSLGVVDGSDAPLESSSSWMHNVLLVDHSKSLVKSAIKHMSKAATYERGKVLKSLVFALKEHISFAEEKAIEAELSFPVFLTRLISQRPSVYAEAVDRFNDLQALTVSVMNTEIVRLASDAARTKTAELRYDEKGTNAKIWLDFGGEESEAIVSLDLLQSCCVLLSIWYEKSTEGRKNDAKGYKKDADAVEEIVKALLKPSNHIEDDTTLGLAGATCIDTDYPAVSVESWIMLCKARNGEIGKKAALSAPEEFLARLLMSSGLPRASLVAMVDRLGKLGATTEEKDKIYRKLMLPSASSEWDLGRLGKQRDIMQKLMGRMSAYFRTGDLDESMSTAFLDWLLKESRLQEKPKKSSRKKAAIAVEQSSLALRAVSKMFSAIKDPLKHDKTKGGQKLEPSYDVSFLSARCQEVASIPETEFSSIIKHHLSETKPDDLERAILDRISDKEQKACAGSIATNLLQSVQTFPKRYGWMVEFLMKWVPYLSKHDCTAELKFLLFQTSEQPATPADVMLRLARKCTHVWAEETILDCSDWIMSRDENEIHKFSNEQTTLFLLDSLELKLKSIPEQQSRKVCAIALNVLGSGVYSLDAANERNDIPHSLRLLLNLAGAGKKHFLLVSEMILLRMGQTPDPTAQHLCGSTLLRLYLLHPQWANTGAAQVRTALLKSAEENEQNWSLWVSKMDDQFDDMLETLALGDSRVVKALSEQSRKYPLLIMRKTRSFIGILKEDASASVQTTGLPTKVRGSAIGRTSEAIMYERKMIVKIRYWGFEFCEAIWVGVLEIFCCIPKEVLYFSGQKLGLWSVLECVLQLLLEQLHLTSANATTKIKAKFTEMLTTYVDVNASGYYIWLGNVVDGSTQVRNALVSLSMMSPEEAIDSLKKAGT